MSFKFLRSSLLATQDIHTNVERDKHVDDCDVDYDDGWGCHINDLILLYSSSEIDDHIFCQIDNLICSPIDFVKWSPPQEDG